jgi:hypothetical protein
MLDPRTHAQPGAREGSGIHFWIRNGGQCPQEASAMTLEFHYDAGHGWLRVPIGLVKRIGSHVSPYSYRDDHFAYLEEDCDMPAFLGKYDSEPRVEPIGYASARFGRRFIEVDDGYDSFIRELARFSQREVTQ